MKHEETRPKLEREAQRRLEAATPSELRKPDAPCPANKIVGGVEKQIQQAMAAGDFDNLPGKGKPLNLRPNPFLDPSQEMAFNILQNASYTPEWIAREQEIRKDEAELQAILARSWAARAENPARWQAVLQQAEELIPKINRKIDTFNLMVPILNRQRFRLSLEYELDRLARQGSPER